MVSSSAGGLLASKREPGLAPLEPHVPALSLLGRRLKADAQLQSGFFAFWLQSCCWLLNDSQGPPAVPGMLIKRFPEFLCAVGLLQEATKQIGVYAINPLVSPGDQHQNNAQIDFSWWSQRRNAMSDAP